MKLPPMHPMASDQIEAERCPECGRPGELIGLIGGLLENWACRVCEPEAS